MNASAPQALGLLIATGAIAFAIVVPRSRWRWIAVAVALVAAVALLAGDVWDDPRVVDLRTSRALVGAAALALLVGLPLGAWVIRRWAWALPLLALAVLALRLPVRIGGETSNLLVALYGVIAAGVLARLWEQARPGPKAAAEPPAEGTAVTWLRRLLAATLVLYALQAFYSEDVSNAIENVCFFLVPFAALFVLLTEVRWSTDLLRTAVVIVAGLAAVYGVIAFTEYAARDLLLNTQLLQSNQLKPFFRVNSVFHDPNVFGRYLALVVIALGAAIAWSRVDWRTGLATGAGVVLLAALVLTFSITSVIALLAGLLVLTALRYGPKGAAVAALAAVVVAGIVYLAAGSGDDLGPDRGDVNKVTSGRAGLVEGGLELAEDRPVAGWGSGAFGRAYFDQIRESETTTSHSEPLTVAAEQGAIGVVAYLALLGSIAWVLFGQGVRTSVARSAVAALMVAMVVHSIGYAGFVIDPVTWALLGIGVALHPGPVRPQG